MKVILRERVEGIGDKWDIKEVTDGYARNFLIPKKLAVVASPSNLSMRENALRHAEEKMKRIRDQALTLVEKIKRLVFVTRKQAGEDGRIHGTVTAMEIADFLQEQGFDIDRKQIHIGVPIKSVGEYEVDIILANDVTVSLRVKVEPEEVST